jgi:uncharacterized membrane protein
MRYLMAYGAAAVVMAGLDITWLNAVMGKLVEANMGPLLAHRTNYAAAGAFYLVYLVGIVWFGVVPALEKDRFGIATLNGALFGFFAYATYDLTNMATLKTWPLSIAALDMAWGSFVTAAAATAGYLASASIRT